MAKAFLQRITAAIDFDPIIISRLQHLIQNRPILLSISGQGETLCLIIRYSSVCTNEIAGRARNDKSKARNDESKARNGVPGHPGPDPGPGSSVCTDERLFIEGRTPQTP